MDLPKIIAELRAERERLESAILALERLKRSGVGATRRGRPPRWKNTDARELPQESEPANAASPVLPN